MRWWARNRGQVPHVNRADFLRKLMARRMASPSLYALTYNDFTALANRATADGRADQRRDSVNLDPAPTA